MTTITNKAGVFIEDGTPCKVVKNPDGTINYIEYTVGSDVFRSTATVVDANTTTYSAYVLQV